MEKKRDEGRWCSTNALFGPMYDDDDDNGLMNGDEWSLEIAQQVAS